MKIEEMGDVFLNSANFATHAFLTLALTSSYTLNLTALIKFSKVSWTYQLSYEILTFSMIENLIRQTSFLRKNRPAKKPFPKEPASFRVKKWNAVLEEIYPQMFQPIIRAQIELTSNLFNSCFVPFDRLSTALKVNKF